MAEKFRGMRGWAHGDRLDKAGQPGGPVSAVYSPTAATWLAHQPLGWPATAEDRTERRCHGAHTASTPGGTAAS